MLVKAIESPFEFEYKFWIISNDKPMWLLNIHFFIEVSILKGIFHVHLKYFELLKARRSKEHSYGLKSSNWCKSFFKVYTFLFRIPFTNKSGLVSNNISIFIQLVFEYPFCPYDILIIWSSSQLLSVILFNMLEFFIHGLDPSVIFACFSYILWFSGGKQW